MGNQMICSARNGCLSSIHSQGSPALSVACSQTGRSEGLCKYRPVPVEVFVEGCCGEDEPLADVKLPPVSTAKERTNMKRLSLSVAASKSSTRMRDTRRRSEFGPGCRDFKLLGQDVVAWSVEGISHRAR